MHYQVRLASEAETAKLARRLANILRVGDCLTLTGPLGVGKTALARSLIERAMGTEPGEEDIPSPTYTLVQTYEALRGPLWHADLFRLSDPDECLELGLDEAFNSAITLVEWPDRLGMYLPDRRLDLSLSFDERSPTTRNAELRANGMGWPDLSGMLT